MEISLSRQQFETLLKTVYLGAWMISAHRERENVIGEFEELERHLWTLAHRAGFRDLVEVDPTLLKVFPTYEFAEALDPFIDEYDDEAFWDGLVDRLADRDLAEAYGDDIMRMDRDERFTRLQRFVDKYETEVEEHGVDRMRIVAT
jgi:hypothetical protein